MMTYSRFSKTAVYLTVSVFVTFQYASSAEPIGMNSVTPAPTIAAGSAQTTPVKEAAPEGSIEFMQSSQALSGAESSYQSALFNGIENGAVLSGTVFIQPRTDAGVSVQKAAYYLNGSQAGREYTAPFTFGGADGFDTTALKDGSYTLSGYLTDYKTKQNISFSYSFTVKNAGVSNPGSTEPSGQTGTQTGFYQAPAPVSDSQVTKVPSVQTVPTQSAQETNLPDLFGAFEFEHQTEPKISIEEGETLESRLPAGEKVFSLSQAGDLSALVIANDSPNTGGFTSKILFRSPRYPQGVEITFPDYLYAGKFTTDGKLTVTDLDGTVRVFNQDGTYAAMVAPETQTTQPEPPSQPQPYQEGYFAGIQNGATLSGRVFVQIRPDANLAVKKVAYYLNGTQAGKEYGSPYTWGGSNGFDTRQLRNGSYTLSGYITTYQGDIRFSYTFQVNN